MGPPRASSLTSNVLQFKLHLTCLILSYLALSCIVLDCLVLSCLIFSCLSSADQAENSANQPISQSASQSANQAEQSANQPINLFILFTMWTKINQSKKKNKT